MPKHPSPRGLPSRRLPVLLAILAVSAASCAQLGEDLSYDPATAPMPVLAQVSSSSRDLLDLPDVVPAERIFRDGETSRSYKGETWVCGNTDCTVAVPQRTSPAPHAKDRPGTF